MDEIRRIEAPLTSERSGAAWPVVGVRRVTPRGEGDAGNGGGDGAGHHEPPAHEEQDEHLEHGVPESLVPGIYGPRGVTDAPAPIAVLPAAPAPTPHHPIEHIDASA